ncbi:MAG: heterodisulfide reductase subunit B [Deltaproteobacteria bacterium]|nr:heterodisulfide reductase subunit B [Deltaproteobacteria bacterium]
MKFAYFPGCSLHSTSSEYDKSFRAVCAALGIELEEPKKWICCGTTPAHATSRLLGAALPVKNLRIMEEQGMTEVVVPCAACFSRFKCADHDIGKDPQLAADVAQAIGAEYGRTVKIRHPLELFLREDVRAILRQKVARPLAGLKVACYYGCLLTRPPEVTQFDDTEYPMSMDLLLRDLGAETIDWAYKVECCGASLSLTNSDIILDLTRKIILDAKARGALALVVACPLCHVNLDSRQFQAEEKYQTRLEMPVLFFSQLIGLALGLSGKELGTDKHLTDPSAILSAVQA